MVSGVSLQKNISMSNKTLIIFGSARSNGNTRKVVDYIEQLVKADVVDLNEKDISYFDYDHLNRDDDFLPLIKNFIQNYDVLVLASPIYWYTMSAQLKNFLDRTSDLLTIEKDLGRQLRGKTLASVSNSDGDFNVDDFVSPIRKSAGYLGMEFLGNAHAFFDENSEVAIEAKERVKVLLSGQKKIPR